MSLPFYALGLISSSLQSNCRDSAFLLCAAIINYFTYLLFSIVDDDTSVIARFCSYKQCCNEHSCVCLLVNMDKSFFGHMSKRDLLDHRARMFTQQGNSIVFKVAEPIYTPTDNTFQTAQ